jgi:hypothetical protein
MPGQPRPDGLRGWRMTATVLPDDLQVPEQLGRRKARKQLLFLAGLVLVVVAVVVLLPGLDGLRTRLSHAQPGWLLLGVGLKVLSGLGYVAVFRMVFCRRMTWRVSFQIGMSELGASSRANRISRSASPRPWRRSSTSVWTNAIKPGRAR